MEEVHTSIYLYFKIFFGNDNQITDLKWFTSLNVSDYITAKCQKRDSRDIEGTSALNLVWGDGATFWTHSSLPP